MASLQFSCTLCGKCCHNHSLPLTMEEAIHWLEDDGTVAIYCESIHTLEEPLDPKKAHRKRRGFRVACGDSCLQVTAILVAVISGACRNLGEDLKCRIYPRRPLVCRIYPAEISPFVQLDPTNKVCPPEAWSFGEQAENGYLQTLPRLAEQSRETDYAEATRKGLLCLELGIRTSGLADEGYVRYMPESQRLLGALKRSWRAAEPAGSGQSAWTLYSASLAGQAARLGLDVIAQKPAEADYQFVRF